MALTAQEQKRIDNILKAERAIFANLAVVLKYIHDSKTKAEAQYALYKAGKTSTFKSGTHYNDFVIAHNKLNQSWLRLKNQYTERQRLYAGSGDSQIRTATDSITAVSKRIFDSIFGTGNKTNGGGNTGNGNTGNGVVVSYGGGNSVNNFATSNIFSQTDLELAQRLAQDNIDNRTLDEDYSHKGNDFIELVQNYKANGTMSGLGVAPIAICIILAVIALCGYALKNIFFKEEASVIKDYKELAVLTQDISKTDPVLAKEILSQYNGAMIADKENNPDFGTQIGGAVKGLIIAGGVLAFLGIGYKVYQANK